MDFRKKLKTRLYIAVGYVVIGVIMAVAVNVLKVQNSFLSAVGIPLIVCGIVRLRNYFKITKDEESIRKQQIAETDERNISISNRAKNAAFAVYIYVTVIAVIVLEIAGKTQLATVLSASVCALVLVYWISYRIISKKS